MKKLIIAALVGGVILFAWNALSWMALPIHHDTFMYTEHQDEILEVVNKHLDKSGTYRIPFVDNREAGMYDEEYKEAFQALEEKQEGKPFFTIFYVKEGMSMDPLKFLMGIVNSFIAVFLVALILGLAQDKLSGFFQRWWLVMLIPVLMCFSGPIVDMNWMGFQWHYVKGIILDHLVSWGLVGAWLSYYMGKA